ncbi:probable Recombinase Flp protein [Zygosaccharomyces bailii ISA1307]|nr:probable Recombinase Flp protein [Zygosaccharomyces bailii ISA1307]
MSDFVELTKILPLEQVAEMRAILDKGPPLPSPRLASLLTIIILTVDISRKRNGSAVKLSTYKKYRRYIAKSLTYDSNTKTVYFEYHLKKSDDLELGLEQIIPPYRFVIHMHKKPVDWQKRLLSVHDRKAGHKSIISNNIGLEISKIAQTKESTWGFIDRTLDLIDACTIHAATRAAYSFLLQLTFMNCCSIIDNKYLGRTLRALVPETKTSIERFLYFFPSKGKCDPLLALDSYLQCVGPINKTQTTDEKAHYTHQLLRDTLLISYDRFISKVSEENIFRIPNGPKAHLGRHMMASYLGNYGLKREATLYCNWATEREEGVSRMADTRYMHTIKKSPPSYLFAFLSGYYEKTTDSDYVLTDPHSNPLEQDAEQRMIFDENMLRQRYAENANVVQLGVLSFLFSYAKSKSLLQTVNKRTKPSRKRSPSTPQSTGEIILL